MIVVSGCPRSGTSLMMLLHKEALGEDRILGTQWMKIDQEYENEYLKKCVEYTKDRLDPQWRENQRKSKEMNPNGFWESQYSVRGIRWVEEAPEADKVCKIVSQGLARSNPAYIDKVILMSRHPWSVAKSHKDLLHNLPFAQIRNEELGDINPKMYIDVTLSVCKWIVKYNPDILIVDFDELITDPDSQIVRLAKFTGEGDWEKAKNSINKKLNRSEPVRLDDKSYWDISLEIYNKFKVGDFQGVINIGERIQQENSKDIKVQFTCVRSGGHANNNMCNKCKQGDATIINNMKDVAAKRKIDWKNEPCLWECGMNPDKNYTPLTISKSIENNHWEQEMKVVSISKKQVQGIAKKEKGFAEIIMAYSVGKTAADFLIPHDKYVLLKEKFGITESLIAEDTPVAPKIMQKSQTKKKGCSTCGRRK